MDLETLRAAKQGLREGLISEQDYDVVKQAFLRAQQLKAGFDVGFIRQEDYQKARDAYLNALDFSVMATRPSGGGPPPLAAAVATPTPARVVAAAAASPRHAVPTAAAASPRGAYAAAVASSPRMAPGAGAAAGGAFVRSPRSSSSSSGAPVARPRVPASPSAAAPRPAINGAPSGAVAAAINGFGGRVATGTVRTAAAPPANGAADHHHHYQGGAGPSAASPQARLRPVAPAAAASSPSSIPKDVPQYSRGATAGKFSMAGIGLTEECVNLFLHMKTRSAYKWITFKVDDSGRLVVPDRVGAKDGRYEHFIAALPPHECRYGVFDYEYTSPERGSFNKIVFINWAPESAHIKTKMMYAATKDFFKGFLDGTGAELQANEAADLSEEEMRQRVVTNLTRK